jgi:hypothetical protein
MYYHCNQFFGSILAGNRLLVTIALSAYVMQLHHVDGLTNLEVRNVVAKSNLQAGDVVPLIGSTGQVWGAVSYLPKSDHDYRLSFSFESFALKLCSYSGIAVTNTVFNLEILWPHASSLHIAYCYHPKSCFDTQSKFKCLISGPP